MQRLTQKQTDGTYKIEDENEAIMQLARYEDMYEALIKEQDKIIADMEKLREEDKTKTVTYKQLLANKLMVMNLLGRFKIYELSKLK